MATRIEVSVTVRGDKNKARHFQNVAQMLKHLGLPETAPVTNYDNSTFFHQTFSDADNFYDVVSYED